MEKDLSLLKIRLNEWKKEKKTNKYGMKKYADRAIKIIKDEIERRAE